MKTARQLSVFLLLIIVLPAFYVGFQMIADPTGRSLGLPAYLLEGSILHSYSVPGWVILVVVVMFGEFTIICILRKARFYSFLIMLQGVMLCVFMLAQMILLQRTFAIQYGILLIGAALVALGVLQNQRKIVADTEKKFNKNNRS